MGFLAWRGRVFCASISWVEIDCISDFRVGRSYDPALAYLRKASISLSREHSPSSLMLLFFSLASHLQVTFTYGPGSILLSKISRSGCPSACSFMSNESE